MSGEIVKVGQNLPVASMGDLKALGEMLAQSGMFGCENAQQGMVLAMTCVQSGMTPLEFSRTYHIIEGKPSMRADAMLAKFVERGGKYTITERTAKRAAAVFESGSNKVEVEYALADAEAAGLTKNKKGETKHNWQAFTKQMLWARLVSDTVRSLDPGVNFGTYTPEEAQDFDDRPVRNVTPAPKVFDTQPPAATATTAAAPPSAKGQGSAATPPPAAPAAEPAKPVTATLVEPEKPTAPAAPVDPNLAPFGKHAGKPWADACFSDTALKAVIGCEDPRITPEMKQAVRIIISKRMGAAAGAEVKA